MQTFDEQVRAGGPEALRRASRFLVGNDSLHTSLRSFAAVMDQEQVPYFICGGWAMVAHGCFCAGTDVEVLVSASGLSAARRASDQTLPNARVKINADTLPPPTKFDGVRFVSLPTLVELKLASGMTNAGRLKDLGDVQELIRVLGLPQTFGDQLNPFVRAKFADLWSAVHDDPTAQDHQ